MKPPLLQTARHNCAFYTPQHRGLWHEWFCLGVVAPAGDAALWTTFCLHQPAADKQRPRAEVVAHWMGPGAAAPRRLAEVYRAEAVGIDPERAGLGIGQSMLGDGACGGRLADAAGSLTWQLQLEDRAAPWLPVASSRLWPLGVGTPGLSVPMVAGRGHGVVELWEGHGSHRQVQRTDIDGWRAFQWHRWGPGPAAPHAFVFAEPAQPAGAALSRLVAIGSPWRLWPGQPKPRVWARLWHQGQVLRFDTWRQLAGGHSQVHGAAWSFVAHSAAGELSGRVDLPAAAGDAASASAAAMGGTQLLTHNARLQIDLVRAGRRERLPLQQAACQVVI